jgi:hypothetical protein
MKQSEASECNFIHSTARALNARYIKYKWLVVIIKYKWLVVRIKYKWSRTTKSLAKTIDDELEKSTEVIDKIILQELKEEFAAGVAGEANDVTAEKEKSRKSKNISAASSSSKFTTPKSSTTRPVSALLCLFLYIIYYIPFLRSLLLYEERQQQQR